jgi:hypothetical protein
VATLIVVRRDASDTFRTFKELAQCGAFSGDVELLLDRRMSERRRGEATSVAVERRVGERRAPASEAEPVFLDEPRRMERRQQPESRIPDRREVERRQRARQTWQTLGFVLVRREAVIP